MAKFISGVRFYFACLYLFHVRYAQCHVIPLYQNKLLIICICSLSAFEQKENAYV